MSISEDVSGTLRAEEHGHQPIVFEPGSATRVGGHIYEDGKAGTIRSNPGDNQQAVVYGICSYDSNAMKSPNPHSGVYQADTTRTLDNNGGNPACNQGGMMVVESSMPTVYGLDRASFNQGKNAKYDFSVEEELAQPIVARGPGGC